VAGASKTPAPRTARAKPGTGREARGARGAARTRKQEAPRAPRTTKAPPPVPAPKRAGRQAAPPRATRTRDRDPGRTPSVRQPQPDTELPYDAETEEPLVPTPTSFNLDLRRARSRRDTFDDTGGTDPNSAEVLAAGDVEVSAESAGAVGDETPGGDNPTPDMDVVDLIGKSLGVEYEDNEELRGAEKIAARDRKRWELDPASSEDYKDRKRG
jgi:hypothetical protein